MRKTLPSHRHISLFFPSCLLFICSCGVERDGEWAYTPHSWKLIEFSLKKKQHTHTHIHTHPFCLVFVCVCEKKCCEFSLPQSLQIPHVSNQASVVGVGDLWMSLKFRPALSARPLDIIHLHHALPLCSRLSLRALFLAIVVMFPHALFCCHSFLSSD